MPPVNLPRLNYEFKFYDYRKFLRVNQVYDFH